MAKSLHCFGEKCSCNLVLDFSYRFQSVSSMPSGLPGSGRVSCRSSPPCLRILTVPFGYFWCFT